MPDIVDEVKEVQSVIVGSLSADGKTLTETGFMTTTTVKLSGAYISEATSTSVAYTVAYEIGTAGVLKLTDLANISASYSSVTKVNNPDLSATLVNRVERAFAINLNAAAELGKRMAEEAEKNQHPPGEEQ
jgi:hypothetical protein